MRSSIFLTLVCCLLSLLSLPFLIGILIVTYVKFDAEPMGIILSIPTGLINIWFIVGTLKRLVK